MVIGTIDQKTKIYCTLLFSGNIFQKWSDVFKLHNFLGKYFIRTNVSRDLYFWCCVQPATAWSLAKKRWVWAKYFIFRCCWLSFASDIGMHFRFKILSWRHTWNFGNCADDKYCQMLFFRIYFVLQFVVPDADWGGTKNHLTGIWSGARFDRINQKRFIVSSTKSTLHTKLLLMRRRHYPVLYFLNVVTTT